MNPIPIMHRRVSDDVIYIELLWLSILNLKIITLSVTIIGKKLTAVNKILHVLRILLLLL